ncbi:MAG TPA: serine O-acetyltransferase EpsC [Ramlibacter sp.]|jgi:serine O-acetyltransferase|uniref:serine O-acetyltransferase EpsC n=1 Tax=Ramlibacter sp. TaxID=1917967 RepID=UPI002D2F3D8D|nr:serine O-acetyltransferase EpsC [Ramlibacter sp.]HZY20280.1 serine O-acetyltransferase EpsC [Ramlibacter sp.]
MSPAFDVAEVVRGLHAARDEWRAARNRTGEARGRELPSPQAVEALVEQLKGALFPMRLGPADLRSDTEDFYVGHTLDTALRSLQCQAMLELRHAAREAPPPDDELRARAGALVRDFSLSLPAVRRLLDTDVLAAWHGDPAARSVDEVLLCYPGVLAMIHHRLAHRLYELGLPLLARIVAEIAHSRTGIDIHPGARIGAGFFIDHGTGVVIGETAVIGERVRLYQNVTLGAKRFPVGEDGHLTKGLPRHPVVEDDVVIYAGATVLGRVTLGKGAVIGGNVWLTQDVPAGDTVVQALASQLGDGKAAR